MESCNGATTPFAAETVLTTEHCLKTSEEKAHMHDLLYCALVGKVMYLATTTRPDIAYAVHELARFMSNYGQTHWGAAKHLLRYLQATKSIGLTLGIHPSLPLTFHAYTDADWVKMQSQHSISGYVVMMGGSPIAWSSKQQAVIALSTCKAEYIACTHTACKVIWLQNLLMELRFTQAAATTLYCDNNGTIACSHDPHGHTCMKHIDIRYHFICECVNRGEIAVTCIDSKDNAANIFTKGLGRTQHKNALRMLNLRCNLFFFKSGYLYTAPQ